jgi:acyl-CoA dehydrogenase
MINADEVQAIARADVLPHVSDAHAGRVDRALIRALGDSGLLGRLFPASMGGTGPEEVSATTLCAVREGLARDSMRISLAAALQVVGSFMLVRAGDDALRAQWLPGVIRGTSVVGLAVTESAAAGSDPAGMTVSAARDSDGWCIQGAKTWIMNAPDADFYTVFARSSQETGSRGITAFLVPADVPGLSGRAIESHAGDAVGTLRFDNVRVPDTYCLGERGLAFRSAMSIFNLFRAAVGASVVGMADTALNLSIAHARTRRAFGRPIGEFQAISHQLAEMATMVQAGRLLVYEAAAAYDHGPESAIPGLCAMAKLFATEAGQRVCDAAVQIHGAVALERGHILEQMYRDVRATRVYEGTTEIQREIIARSLLRAGHADHLVRSAVPTSLGPAPAATSIRLPTFGLV